MDPRSASQDFAGCTADECENTEPFEGERMPRIFGGENGIQQESSLNTLPQKENDYFKLLEKIRLLGGADFKLEENPACKDESHEDLFNPSCKIPLTVGADTQSVGSGSQNSHYSKQQGENGIGIKLPNVEDNGENCFQEGIHLQNAHILSEIFNENLQNTNDENKFMKVLFELNGIVKSLKEQKEIKDKKLAEVQRKLLSGSSELSKEVTNTDLCHHLLKGKEFRNQSNIPFIGNEDSHETIEYNQGGACFGEPISDNTLKNENFLNKPEFPKFQTTPQIFRRSREKNEVQGKGPFPKHWRQKDLKDAKKQAHIHDRGKSIISVIENIAIGQQKEVSLMECLFIKLEDLAKSEDLIQYQTSVLKNLEQRISNIEKSLNGNTFHSSKYEEEINDLCQELAESNKVKEEFKCTNILIKNEFSNLYVKLSLSLNKIEKLTEMIEEMKNSKALEKSSTDAKLNELIKKTIEEEKKYFIEKEGQLLNQIKNLQFENNELKQRMVQVEEDSKRVAEEHKTKFKKLKKNFQRQFSIASQKLLTTGNQVKEFVHTMEKLLRGLYKHMYEGKLNSIKKKCLEEQGVKDASSILGVTASQMTKVLAAEFLPNFNDWLETCNKFTYKEKFSDELSTFVIALMFPGSQNNVERSFADFYSLL